MDMERRPEGNAATSRGAPKTSVNSYVNALRKSVGGFSQECLALDAKVPKNQRYPIQKFEVRNCAGMYAPLMQIYLAMLFSANAKSWPSGRSLADVVGEALPSDPLAVHHIFPKKFMLSLEFPAGQGDGTWSVTANGVEIHAQHWSGMLDVDKLPDGTFKSGVEKAVGKYCK